MPFYVLTGLIASIIVLSGWGERFIIVIMMFVGLSVLSELLNRVVKVDEFKDYSNK
jgi:hypothetical protein